jgi:hypothetical protein
MMQPPVMTKATGRDLETLLGLVERYRAFEEIPGFDRTLLSPQLGG